MTRTYPKPDASLQVVSLHPQPLRGILPPPSTSVVEDLLQNRLGAIDHSPLQIKLDKLDTYVRTTHVIPAALPRTLSKGAYPPAPSSKDERKEWVKTTSGAIYDKKQACERGETVEGVDLNAVEPMLFNVLDRYAIHIGREEGRKGKGITLLLTHATGFPRRVCGHSL